ncbi:MAG: DNA mismatch repair protein MutS, partial [Gemmatimonadota bacterium]
MEQYMRLKRQHEDAILFFRMGDFYEMFYDDAREASRLLGLTLTARNHGRSSGDVPLAGVPHHQLEPYVAKLIRLGRKVAICEQVEDPRQAKGLVKRDVVQVVSPGTALSDTMLDRQRNNYTASLCADGGRVGIALVDLSTGDFTLDEVSADQLRDELERSAPAELLVSRDAEAAWVDSLRQALPGVALSRAEDWQFEYRHACETLAEQLGVQSLRSYDLEGAELAVRAGGAAVEYLRENQRGALEHMRRLRRRRREDALLLDASAQRHLDLVANQQDGGRDHTLLQVLDRTCTPMGARMLRQWITAPRRDPAAIGARLDAVADLAGARQTRARLRQHLEGLGDLERMMARLCCRRGNARDLVGLATSLERVPAIAEAVAELPAPLIRRLVDGELPRGTDLVELVRRALVEEPPAATTEGGMIRPGYCAELDELREVATGGRQWIARLQTDERERTGIASLKVGYNQVFGYYIEVSKANLERVPADYTRRQTLTNAERFVTPELKDHEARVLGAQERIESLEGELFAQLRDQVAGWAGEVQQAAGTLAQVDVLATLAEVAEVEGYVRPTVDDTTVLEIEGGRHAVVERQLPAGRFVPNDVRADTETDQVLLITGPNMAGKSTIIRQVGLIVLLAQMGSFVPARRARIGAVDRIFTRVGASDNLARGESTFMVEMIEAATILNNVTDRSLILMDELGRGTSTYDGLSLAWSIVEYLHDGDGPHPRTLFATHYHELTELEARLARVRNYNVQVREEGGHVAFLHRLAPGPCDRSYGIHVAQMAGMPGPVVARAEEILAHLEREQVDPEAVPAAGGDPATAPQLDLFGAA